MQLLLVIPVFYQIDDFNFGFETLINKKIPELGMVDDSLRGGKQDI